MYDDRDCWGPCCSVCEYNGQAYKPCEVCEHAEHDDAEPRQAKDPAS